MVKNRCNGSSSRAVVGAVVLIVSVAVAAVVPEIVTGEVMEQVGGSVKLVGLTVHDRATLPVKPLLGLI